MRPEAAQNQYVHTPYSVLSKRRIKRGRRRRGRTVGTGSVRVVTRVDGTRTSRIANREAMAMARALGWDGMDGVTFDSYRIPARNDNVEHDSDDIGDEA